MMTQFSLHTSYFIGISDLQNDEKLAENINKFADPKFVAELKKNHTDLGSYENERQQKKL